VLCKAAEISTVNLDPSVERGIFTTITIETTNADLPRASTLTFFHGFRIGEIYGRLKAMQTKSKAPTTEVARSNPVEPESDKLADAIEGLTKAVFVLTDVVKSLVSERRRPPSTTTGEREQPPKG